MTGNSKNDDTEELVIIDVKPKLFSSNRKAGIAETGFILLAGLIGYYSLISALLMVLGVWLAPNWLIINRWCGQEHPTPRATMFGASEMWTKNENISIEWLFYQPVWVTTDVHSTWEAD